MAEIKNYAYRGRVIQLRYALDNHCCDAGWYWEIFWNSESITDNSKSCPDSSIRAALIFATRVIDDAIGTDSGDYPVELPIET